MPDSPGVGEDVEGLETQCAGNEQTESSPSTIMILKL